MPTTGSPAVMGGRYRSESKRSGMAFLRAPDRPCSVQCTPSSLGIWNFLMGSPGHTCLCPVPPRFLTPMSCLQWTCCQSGRRGTLPSRLTEGGRSKVTTIMVCISPGQGTKIRWLRVWYGNWRPQPFEHQQQGTKPSPQWREPAASSGRKGSARCGGISAPPVSGGPASEGCRERIGLPPPKWLAHRLCKQIICRVSMFRLFVISKGILST